MSGVAGGLLMLPFVLTTAPGLAPVIIGAAVLRGAVSVAGRRARNRQHLENMRSLAAERRAAQQSRNYEDQRDAQIRRMAEQARLEAQRNGAVNESVRTVRNEMTANISEQARLSEQTSQQMYRELETSRRRSAELAANAAPAQFTEYMNELRVSSKELTAKIQAMNDGFVKNYHTKIGESMENISRTVNSRFDAQMNELRQFGNDIKAKNEKAAQIAAEYIAEADELLTSLERDYDADRFSAQQLAVLRRELSDAARQYELGNYEAAIAAAKDTAISAIEETYSADCKRKEWENSYDTALTLSAELNEFLEAQEIITEDVKRQIEEKDGKPLEAEIVGLKISDYTDKRPDGMTQFCYLKKKAQEINALLESDKAYDLDTRELKSYIDIISGKLYPSAAETVYKGIQNMSNAFSRQNISEEIIDFFEEHNFTFKGYSYDNGAHCDALHIGLENEDSGEEIIVTLAPELVNGEVQTKVEIDQIMGDEANEERKAFYRKSIEEVVCENTPGAQISLECDKSYKNRLSDKTGLRDKLKQ